MLRNTALANLTIIFVITSNLTSVYKFFPEKEILDQTILMLGIFVYLFEVQVLNVLFFLFIQVFLDITCD